MLSASPATASAANFVLGISGHATESAHPPPMGLDQLTSPRAVGLFTAELPADREPTLADRSASTFRPILKLERESYLHVNCSTCHIAAGGGNARMNWASPTAAHAEVGTDRSQTAARLRSDIANAMLIAPRRTGSLRAVERLSRRGHGQMPPLVLHQADKEAVALMREWIAGAQALETLRARMANG